ncbi:MAG: hypothetical protein ACJA0U_002658 [Salibacteraceae bacterium]
MFVKHFIPLKGWKKLNKTNVRLHFCAILVIVLIIYGIELGLVRANNTNFNYKQKSPVQKQFRARFFFGKKKIIPPSSTQPINILSF